MQFISESLKDTYSIAEEFASTLKGEELISLEGEIGAGKTHFVKGIAKHFGMNPNDIISPTFVLRRDYNISNTSIFHIDLYRLESVDEATLESLGFFDILKRGIILVEWGEKADTILKYDKKVLIKEIEGNKREITISQL